MKRTIRNDDDDVTEPTLAEILLGGVCMALLGAFMLGCFVIG